MKPKTRKQKLSLKKQTISNLSNVDLAGVKGGIDDSTGSTCTICTLCYIESDRICMDTSQLTVCNTTP